MIRAAIRAFVFDGRAPVVIDGRHVPIDADLAARNAARIAECRQRLGSHWICSSPINAGAMRGHRADCATAPEPQVQVLPPASLHPDLPAMLDRDRFELQR